MGATSDLLVLTLAFAVMTGVLLVLSLVQLRELRRMWLRPAGSPPPPAVARVETAAADAPRYVADAPPSESGPRACVRGGVLVAADGNDDPEMSSDDTMESAIPLPFDQTPLVSELANDPDIADLVLDFANVLGTRADALLTAFSREDAATLKRVAHQLKGAAGGYGFPTISEQARQVEEAIAGSGDRAEVKRAIDGLCTLCFRASLGVPTLRTPRAVA